MWVTIYTDASYSREKRYAAIAYYIRSDQGLIQHSEPIAFKKTRDNNEAEMIAIERAILRCINAWGQSVQGIQINTDSLASRDVLKFQAKKSGKYSKIQERVNSIRESKGFRLRIKHVLAHQTDDNVRTWLNNWCDQKAKSAHQPKLERAN